MERIKDAIELAKARGAVLGGKAALPNRHMVFEPQSDPKAATPLFTAVLNKKHLEANRIIAHNVENRAVAAFDVLRTNISQEMVSRGWQSIVVTSPTPGCGKTVTAINLALSMARMPDQQVVLLDLDLRRPLVGTYLGLQSKAGLSDLISGKASLNNAMVHLDISNDQLGVIANTAPLANSAEVIGSSKMASLLDQIKNNGKKPIVIIDTPPMLATDDVLALLPQIDCVILAVAERISTAAHVTACERHLQATNYLGLVLTKSQEKTDGYYY